jgi:hypothetical protein
MTQMQSRQGVEPLEQALKVREQFKFDLEKQVDDLRAYQKLTERASKCIYDLKEQLRKGGSETEVQEWRALTLGYTALDIVLKRSRARGSLQIK